MREAPSRVLIDELIACGAHVAAYDPIAIDEAKKIYRDEPRLTFSTSALDACDGADALAIVTEWKEFRSPDFIGLKARLKTPLIFDGRNLYDSHLPTGAGLEYIAIGRNALSPDTARQQ